MQTTISGDIARLHQAEMVAQASRLQEVERARRSTHAEPEPAPRKSRTIVLYKKALEAVALSLLFLTMMGTALLASPTGPGAGGGAGVGHAEQIARVQDQGASLGDFVLPTLVAVALLAAVGVTAIGYLRSHRPAVS